MTAQDSQSELDEILFRLSVGKIDEAMGNMFPKEALDKARQDVIDNDPEYKIAREAIEAYVTTRVKEAERQGINKLLKHFVTTEDYMTNLGEFQIRKTRNKLGDLVINVQLSQKAEQALTTTTNGKGE